MIHIRIFKLFYSVSTKSILKLSVCESYQILLSFINRLQVDFEPTDLSLTASTWAKEIILKSLCRPVPEERYDTCLPN